jgi:hypothetical protein
VKLFGGIDISVNNTSRFVQGAAANIALADVGEQTVRRWCRSDNPGEQEAFLFGWG